MSNIPEPKFKKGDKVKTNELFKHEYAGDPGFRGIVTNLHPAYFMPGSDSEVITLNADVKIWNCTTSINQDYIELYEGDIDTPEREATKKRVVKPLSGLRY